MKEIVESFFKNESIVSHQIDSMNAFVATPDNPDSLMQKIVDETRLSDEDESGVIVLDKTKTGGKEIKIYFGRQKERGRYIGDTTIRIDMPEIKEASGAINQITPQEARIRDLNYTAPISLKLRVSECIQ